MANMQAPAPGTLFGVPGITRGTEQIENNDGNTTTLSQTSATSALSLVPFKQTDIIKGWLMRLSVNQTVTTGTGTATLGAYYPDQYLGRFQLNFQNQFNAIDVESGIDMRIFNTIRPYRQTNYKNAGYTQPTVQSYSSAANLLSSNSYTTGSTLVQRVYWIPGGLQFDEYWNLKDTGEPTGAPLPMFVSPQFMAGTARIVQPYINYNPAFATVSDGGPMTATGVATFSGSAVVNLKRVGWYQPQYSNGADSPPVANWQYTLKTVRRSIAGQSGTIPLLLPLNGQILSVYVRLFDPAANGALGAPITVNDTNQPHVDLVYGSNLYKFQDRPSEVQERFEAQHGEILPQGVLAWDMAIDERGRITNANVLNTMNTSGVQINLQTNAAFSASAYAVVGVEALTYVAVGN
jgi:hypothetical protein